MLWYHINISVSDNLGLFYTKIFFKLRHHQNQFQDLVQQPNQTNQLNITRYRKAVYTAIWLQLTLVACYLSYGVVTILAPSSGRNTSVYYAWRYAFTLVFLNSSLNPVFYCWKTDRRRQTSGEGHSQTRAMPLFFDLALQLPRRFLPRLCLHNTTFCKPCCAQFLRSILGTPGTMTPSFGDQERLAFF